MAYQDKFWGPDLLEHGDLLWRNWLVLGAECHTCTGECIALGFYPQNHNITDIVITDLIIVSDVELITGNPFDIGGVLKQHIC